MAKTTAIERAQAKVDALKELEPDQRAELLKMAGIGLASQARAIGRAFRVLEAALDADDLVMSGRKGAVKTVSRPNWDARLRAARTLWEVLGATAQKKTANAPSRVAIQVNLPAYASGEATVIEMDAAAVETEPVGYSAAYAKRVASRSDGDEG